MAYLFFKKGMKFFAEAFFQKGRKVFWHTFFQKRYKVFRFGLFSKRPKLKKAGAGKIRASRRAFVTDFAEGRQSAPTGVLRPVGRAFCEGCGPGKGRCPRKRPRPARDLGRFLTRRLLKKAGENF
ncbi:hypothetical protein D3Z39_08375 [Anaerotruncus colihominis]|uniref:Uncharacterized protein n=1 Tax=Anaerotruncus colihominis TaxID=169435 RepID=A0A845RGZ3_9FIRM|nr:hypothetical protein [Anaerotruncus colihominis]